MYCVTSIEYAVYWRASIFHSAGNIGLNWPTRYCTSELYGESPLIHKLGEVHCFYEKVKCVPQQGIDFTEKSVLTPVFSKCFF